MGGDCFSGGPRVCRALSRRGDARQVGEARALASLAAARRHSWAFGQAEAKAILTRRALILTSAPSFSSFRRIGPQAALANPVGARPIGRGAHGGAEAVAGSHSRS